VGVQKPPKKQLTGFRITKTLKEVATKAARMECRSFSNYLENLIATDAERKNIPYKRGT